MDTKAAFLFLILVFGFTEVTANNRTSYCYGDLCNRGKNIQFCSETFRLCRNCEEVTDSCGTHEQPLDCMPFCVEYLAEKKLERKREAKCHSVPRVENGHIVPTNDTTAYNQGDVLQLDCSTGFILQFINQATCGPFGQFTYQTPTCKEIRCSVPPELPNGNIIHIVDDDSHVLGSTVAYECKDGYSSYGDMSMRCTEQGIWGSVTNTVGPVCIKDPINLWMYACVILALFLVLVAILFLYKSILKLCRRILSAIVEWTLPVKTNKKAHIEDEESALNKEECTESTPKRKFDNSSQNCRPEIDNPCSDRSQCQLLIYSKPYKQGGKNNDCVEPTKNGDGTDKCTDTTCIALQASSDTAL